MIEPEDRLKENDLVIVLMSKFETPNFCYADAIKILLGRQDVKEVWLFPLPSNRSKEHTLNICNILSMSLASKGFRSAVCLLAMENEQVGTIGMAHCSLLTSVPYLKFKVACFEEEGLDAYYPLLLSTKNTHEIGKEVIVIRGNLQAKQKEDFEPLVWDYLKKNGLN
jgi:hypothetical protein